MCTLVQHLKTGINHLLTNLITCIVVFGFLIGINNKRYSSVNLSSCLDLNLSIDFTVLLNSNTVIYRLSIITLSFLLI